ncbi:MAG TPA: thioredoxin domain-containing protein, partial [Herpetosiphonaceae bacterium]|nr:thioredoxin domain-containing protein [Herpetosiphonaceae bacterium]
MSHKPHDGPPKHTNRLINETSPYLLKHAHDPVDWYAWGEEALAKSTAENKPIHLSVGYRACHWCSVLHKESFEDEATAALMNEHFINIKVDREERPDIDSIYMAAVQAMTRHGGWPMTVFLTPDGAPFYGGTYFPPEPRHGLPSFTQVLTSVAAAYRERPEDVAESAGQLREHLREISDLSLPPTAINARMLALAAEQQMSQFDQRFGGYGNAPKFPQAMTLEMVLRHWRRAGDRAALNQVDQTLRAMANGGIYDQLGGGFARYSVDAYWLVPHFEKMLYDNALLARLYVELFQASGDPFFRRIAEETFAYVERDMTSPEGGFYASEDADSEGEEGTFYIWTPAQIRAALGADDAELALRYWDVTERGNFEGKSILSVPRDPAVVAREFGLGAEELAGRIAAIRSALLAVRSERERPARDEKILAAWNGMMLRAYALASRVLDRADYREIARRNGEFILDRLVVDGRLRRSYKDGQAKFNGYLEDYANVADGMLALYEATF